MRGGYNVFFLLFFFVVLAQERDMENREVCVEEQSCPLVESRVARVQGIFTS